MSVDIDMVMAQYGADLQPIQKPGQEALILRDHTLANEGRIAEDSFDCPLCADLLYNPITTSCGHTYCKGCILKCMHNDNKCPLCRGIIHVTREYGVNVMMQQLIQLQFPVRFAARKKEEDELIELEQSFVLSLFLLGTTVVFPGQRLPLHVFEPRYQHMVKRCLTGSKRFGVVPTSGTEIAPTGCCVLIQNYHEYPDGRVLLQIQGCQRFRLGELWDSEGCKQAKVEYFEDAAEVDAEAVEAKYKAVLQATTDQFGEGLKKAEARAGSAMPTSNAAEFTWWLGAALPALPPQGKYMLLGMNKVSERLDLLSNFLDVLRLEGTLKSLRL